ncbi:MAG TPA: cupin domain-containing protein [Methylocystis sp.]|nr:cupin domain-containing protein [Methylocystis sp.]
MSTPEPVTFRKAQGEGCAWEGVERLNYKEEGSAPFKAISRQTLFSSPHLAGELRYFEIEPGGYSTLERHEHAHAVVILRGRGSCLVGDEVREIDTQDLVSIAPWTWHQFRARRGEALGFLCLVNSLRDKPQLPTEEQLAVLRENPAIAAFLDANGE